jgi:VWFA-related protein
VVESKRPGRIFGKAQIQLKFDELVLPDGTSLPLSARLSRAGWWDPNGKIQAAGGEGSKKRDIYTIGQGAAQGAILGGIFGGRRGLTRGATAGGAAGLVAVLLERGPDLDLPPGMMFEIELQQPLSIPLGPPPAQRLANLPANWTPEAGGAGLPADVASPPTPPPDPVASTLPAAPAETKPAETTRAANRTVLGPAVSPATLPPDPAVPPPATGGFKLKVEVNLILVEATVRNQQGRIIDNLKREDFRLLEDGTEQEIQHFSRDELPLAVALVIDRSGSVAPILDRLRRAAYDTLSQLKPDDEVALFAFASKAERLEYLTTDRQRIADRIRTIQPGGGTNITDALFDAALYLGRAAAKRRHAIILVSDNQATVKGFASERELIRLALETETVVYSIKVGGGVGGGFHLPVWIPGAGSVNKVTRETGGEIIVADDVGSLENAMAIVLARLKQRYTLGYQSTNRQQDGAFRTIDVQIRSRAQTPGEKYTVYARRGYYAPLAHAAGSKSP